MSEYVDLSGMLYALQGRIRTESYSQYHADTALCQIRRMQDKAIAYVWGREDQAGRKIRETYGRENIDASWDFGYMVAIMVAMSYLESGWRWSQAPNIRDTFAAFIAGVELWEYVDSRWPS